MITSVAGAAEKTSGTAVRINADDAVKRTDSTRAPRPAVSPSPESAGSSVVEISSEGARRAAQQQQLQSQERVRTAPADPIVSKANEQTPALATATATATATQESSSNEASVAAETSSTGSSNATSKQETTSTVKEFDDADTNQDYTVSVLERRAYDFLHPSLNGSSEPDQAAALEAQKEAQSTRAVDAELKAYTEIAKAGRLA